MFSANLESKLDLLDNTEVEQNRLSKQLEIANEQLKKAAGVLTKIRNDGSVTFGKSLENHLKDLGMSQCNFQVQIEEKEISASGADSVEFLVSTNPGEPLKPLAKVASGGELSRLMLALKTVLSESHYVPTLVFDEIDVGVGGITAKAIGQKIAALANKSQVFCITHLPQIASLPTNAHISIKKVTQSGRTTVQIEILSNEERVNEIARMLGGHDQSSVVQDHAKELLANSK
jgi:DNA repair protein RecN (Recombination protein N)